MLNLKKGTKTTQVYAYHRAQLTYTTHYRRVLIIFSPILQTIVTAQMMSAEGRGKEMKNDVK